MFLGMGNSHPFNGDIYAIMTQINLVPGRPAGPQLNNMESLRMVEKGESNIVREGCIEPLMSRETGNPAESSPLGHGFVQNYLQIRKVEKRRVKQVPLQVREHTILAKYTMVKCYYLLFLLYINYQQRIVLPGFLKTGTHDQRGQPWVINPETKTFFPAQEREEVFTWKLNQLISNWKNNQLNGSHGEHTCDDDMLPIAKKALRDLERTRREADNLKHQRPTDNRGKARSNEQVQFDKRQTAKTGGAEVVKFEPKIEEKQVETLTCFVVPSIGLYEIQGQAYSYIPNGYEEYVSPEGADVSPWGYKLKVQSSGFGWFILSDDESKNRSTYVTAASCTLYNSDGFTYRDVNNRLVNHPAVSFLFYKPLFVTLIKQIKAGKITDFIVSSALSVASNTAYLVDGVTPNHPVIESTLEAYKHYLFKRSICAHDTNTRRFISLNFDELGHHETQHALHNEAWIDQNHMVVDKKFCAWTEESITTSELDLMSWEPRRDFEILLNRGVNVEDGRFRFGEDTKVPKRFKITKFFEFAGMGLQPFNKHTRCNENLDHGCKRLIGCRVSEAVEYQLRMNSIRMAQWFADPSDAHHQELLNMCIGKRTVRLENCSPILPGFDAFIKDSFGYLQTIVCPSYVARVMDSVKTWIHASKYAALASWYEHSPFYGRELWAKIPNAKAKQREQFVNGRHYHYEEYSALKSMAVCIKDEIGKCGKPCRLFVNLDTESAYAPLVPMHVKLGLHGTHMFKIEEVMIEVFVYAQPNPSSDELDHVAQKCADARFLQDYVFVAIHSDDSCMAGNVRGRSIMSNNDVSSNDAGQDAAVFFGMSLLQSNFSPQLALGLLKLACLPIDIASPTSEAFLRLLFNSPYEPSGHSNTSVWNHLGSILLSLSAIYYMVHTDKPYAECVKLGAEQVGHVVTCDEVDCVEKIQFLKFSPVLCGDRYVMCANLGRIFRKLGCVDGDMTHDQLGVDVSEFRSLTTEERMNRFWTGVITGLKHEPSNRILDALRKRFSSSSFTVTESALSFLQDETKDSYYMHNRTAKTGDCTASIMRRYDLTEEDVDELVAVISDLHVGQRWRLSSVAQFYKMDYGVGMIVDEAVPVQVGTVEYNNQRQAIHRQALLQPVNPVPREMEVQPLIGPVMPRINPVVPDREAVLREPEREVHRPVRRDIQQGNAEPAMNPAPVVNEPVGGILMRMFLNRINPFGLGLPNR